MKPPDELRVAEVLPKGDSGGDSGWGPRERRTEVVMDHYNESHVWESAMSGKRGGSRESNTRGPSPKQRG